MYWRGRLLPTSTVGGAVEGLVLPTPDTRNATVDRRQVYLVPRRLKREQQTTPLLKADNSIYCVQTSRCELWKAPDEKPLSCKPPMKAIALRPPYNGSLGRATQRHWSVSKVLGRERIPRGDDFVSATCLFAGTLRRGLLVQNTLAGPPR